MRIRKGYADASVGQVHYRSAGDSGAVVVLLHQTASSSRMFEPLMRLLSGEYRVIALDTPGFGGSDPYPTAPTIPQLVKVLREAVSSLGIERFHLVGHHTGAALAAEWAAADRDSVQSVTMVGALALSQSERDRWHQSITAAEISPDGGHLQAAWARVAQIDRTPVKFPPDTALRHRESVDVLVASPRWPEAYLAVFSHDTAATIARIRCPQLLVCGREDILWDYLDDTAALLSNGTVFTLDAGAYVLEQHLDQVFPVLRDFLMDPSSAHTTHHSIEKETP